MKQNTWNLSSTTKVIKSTSSKEQPYGHGKHLQRKNEFQNVCDSTTFTNGVLKDSAEWPNPYATRPRKMSSLIEEKRNKQPLKNCD